MPRACGHEICRVPDREAEPFAEGFAVRAPAESVSAWLSRGSRAGGSAFTGPRSQTLEQARLQAGPARFTTRELHARELALASRDVDASRPDRRVLARVIMESRRELTGDQGMLAH